MLEMHDSLENEKRKLSRICCCYISFTFHPYIASWRCYSAVDILCTIIYCVFKSSSKIKVLHKKKQGDRTFIVLKCISPSPPPPPLSLSAYPLFMTLYRSNFASNIPLFTPWAKRSKCQGHIHERSMVTKLCLILTSVSWIRQNSMG